MRVAKQRFRLITRSDFDGLVCAALFQDLDLINEIMFVHPKDMQDGKITVTSSDITANLPYVETCHLAFDHHYSETLRKPNPKSNQIIQPNAPSTARVVYEHFGGAQGFKRISASLIEAVDKADSADFSLEEIQNPSGWTLLSFLMDARTGLGRYKHFRISNYQLMMDLILYCRKYDIDAIMRLPDIKERLDLYFSHEQDFENQLRRCTRLTGELAVVDLREEKLVYAGNRFKIFALFPECLVALHIIWGLQKQNTVIAAGKSILNRSHPVNLGALMLRYGGGGHAGAGTCQIPNSKADEVLRELSAVICERDGAPSMPTVTT